MRSIVGRLACAIGIAACGRVGFDPRAFDARSDGMDMTDAPLTVLPLCDVSDDFEDGTTAPFWNFYRDTAGTDFVETGGEFQITWGDQRSGSYAGYETMAACDMTARGAWIELAAAPPALVGGACFLSIVGTTHTLEVGVTADQFQLELDGSLTASYSFSYPAQRWWRIRESGGAFVVDTSPDGAIWTFITSHPDTTNMASAVHLNVGGGTYQAITGGDVCRFASVNR